MTTVLAPNIVILHVRLIVDDSLVASVAGGTPQYSHSTKTNPGCDEHISERSCDIVRLARFSKVCMTDLPMLYLQLEVDS